MDIKAIAALIVSGISALSGILALALPYWRKDDSGYSGLWKACQKIGVFGLTTCFSIEDAPSSLNATRAMVILGMIVSVAGLALFCLRLFVLKENVILKRTAGIVSASGGVLYIIGAIIYDAANKPEGYVMINESLSAAYGLVNVAGILAITAGVIMIFMKNEQ